jgi:hypothetical protein
MLTDPNGHDDLIARLHDLDLVDGQVVDGQVVDGAGEDGDYVDGVPEGRPDDGGLAFGQGAGAPQP